MQQTMQAILAIVVIMTAFSSLNSVSMRSQDATLRREIEEMAGSVAIETMEIVRAREFDDMVVAGLNTGDVTDKALFTYNGSVNHFPTGRQCSVFGTGTYNCDDIDDFHKMATADHAFEIAEGVIHFAVDVDVEYVDDAGNRVDMRTFNKRITVKVKDKWGNPNFHYLATPIQLSRTISYKFPKKAV